MKWVKGLSVAFLLLVIIGAIAGGGSKTKNTTTTKTVTTVVQAVPSAHTLAVQLNSCVKSFHARLASSTPTDNLLGSIAAGAAGNVPAAYIGAVVFEGGASADIWIADSPEEAVKTANQLNQAENNANVPNEDLTQAFNDGRVVVALANTQSFGKVSLSQSQAFDNCTKAIA